MGRSASHVSMLRCFSPTLGKVTPKSTWGERTGTRTHDANTQTVILMKGIPLGILFFGAKNYLDLCEDELLDRLVEL
ncbi:hypothetical protein CDAR_207091 [Caerostris darwini]|uniref:Essential MCU regulator, mitochondrial n=1 Tax=Caerostris darwini TaxID=1538125 RepID=A0AAV4SRU1_9ARAC|nr:hypothetical protein CDAR_207091 [Caerostris darwini]